MRLANEICAAAMEHVRGELRPGMKESEAAAIWQAFVHGEGTGWEGKVDLALGFSLVWSGAGIKTFTATGAPAGAGARADAVRDLGLRGRLLVRPHEAPLPGRARRRVPASSSAGCSTCTSARSSIAAPDASFAELDRARPRRDRRRSATRDSRRIRSATASERAHTSRRTRTRRPAASSRRGWCSRSSRAATGTDGGGLRVEDNFLITGDGAEKLSSFPDGVVHDDVSDLIWTGSLNDAYAVGGRVGLYDTTLRDGEQTVGVVLDPDEKLEIARLLDELGVDRIEAGFPRVSDDDWRAVELIAAAGLRAEIWGFSRAVPADLEALVELGVRHSVIESPISDLKLDAIGVSRDKMLDRITAAMRFAADHGIHAAFFGVDSTRARARLLRARLRDGRRGRREGGRRRRHARDRVAGGGRGARRAHGRARRRAGALSRAQRLRRRDGERRRRGARGCVVGARHDQRHGRARGQREPRRGRAHAARALRGRDEPAARPDPRGLRARARALRLRPRALEARHRRDALPARERGGRVAVPRPAVDRAVLVRARRDRAARSCSARRAASTRSASRPRSSASTCRRSAARSCSQPSRSSAPSSGGS